MGEGPVLGNDRMKDEHSLLDRFLDNGFVFLSKMPHHHL